MNESSSNSLLEKTSLWIATGLGFGFAPKAPGTVGAVWGIPLAWAVMQIPNILVQIAVLVVLYLVGIPICTLAAKSLGKKDPGEVVWDEIVTVPIAFLFVEPRLMGRPEVLLLGFVLHRLFDISKPPPVRNLERLPDGLGIMTDDVAAAFYACGTMHLLLWAWPWLSR
jgi:phosphatidylglycerophosphatase A